MHSIEQVVTLLNAGFTADEIRAMQQTADSAAPSVPADSAAPSVPAIPDAPAVPNAPAQSGADMAAVLQSIATLTAAVQANGIAASQQPAQPNRADVLASIIVPNK